MPRVPRCCRARVLVAFGAFSLFVAALFIVKQQGIKRLMAYSSVEHMRRAGAGDSALAAHSRSARCLYHMLNHSLNKSLMFFGAGNVMRRIGTKEISGIRERVRSFPGDGRAMAGGCRGDYGCAPFGLFLSELT